MTQPTNSLELTILMPCLNEAETLEVCIKKALRFLAENNVSGEVLIADNGSTDGSQEIARACGARVVDVPQRGYGAALIGGTNAALGRYTIMGDADDSYDFTALMPFVLRLRDGADLVMGDRFAGGIEKGAMPPLHKYIGNPVLSFVGRVFFHSKIRDFHCGLRGYNTQKMRDLGLKTLGMEYASEMVVQATLHGYRIDEVPTTLAKDGRSRPPHLRSFRDGWRHLKFLLMHSPNWLFLYPGLALFVLGLVMGAVLVFKPITVAGVVLDLNTLLFSMTALIVGFTIVLFAAFTKQYAITAKYIVPDKRMQWLLKLTTEKGMISGAVLVGIGVVLSILSVAVWGKSDFGNLNPESFMRMTMPAATMIIIGAELFFAGFFLDILRIERR